MLSRSAPISPADAERIWRERIERDPHSFDAHVELARLYARRGAMRPAMREYHTLRKLLKHEFAPDRTLRIAGARAGSDAFVERSALAAFAAHRSEATRRLAELRSFIRTSSSRRKATMPPERR
jgi:DNA-binding SARP family transcriptional activator